MKTPGVCRRLLWSGMATVVNTNVVGTEERSRMYNQYIRVCMTIVVNLASI